MSQNSTSTDVLQELASIAAGHAATALSQLTKKKVTISVSRVTRVTLEEVVEHLGYAEERVTAVVLQMTQDLAGLFLLLIYPEQTGELVKNIRLSYSPAGLSENSSINESVSVLKEMANIVCGAAITALSQFLDLSVYESIPDSTTDYTRAIIDSVVAEWGETLTEVLLFETELVVGSSHLYICYLFDPSSSEKIVSITERMV